MINAIKTANTFFISVIHLTFFLMKATVQSATMQKIPGFVNLIAFIFYRSISIKVLHINWKQFDYKHFFQYVNPEFDSERCKPANISVKESEHRLWLAAHATNLRPQMRAEARPH